MKEIKTNVLAKVFRAQGQFVANPRELVIGNHSNIFKLTKDDFDEVCSALQMTKQNHWHNIDNLGKITPTTESKELGKIHTDYLAKPRSSCSIEETGIILNHNEQKYEVFKSSHAGLVLVQEHVLNAFKESVKVMKYITENKNIFIIKNKHVVVCKSIPEGFTKYFK